LANMLEGGLTPILSPEKLKALGYTGVAAYPLTLLSASIKAMNEALQSLKKGQCTDSFVLPFQKLQTEVGFEEYYSELDRYTNWQISEEISKKTAVSGKEPDDDMDKKSLLNEQWIEAVGFIGRDDIDGFERFLGGDVGTELVNWQHDEVIHTYQRK
jgi:hypothetical protein